MDDRDKPVILTSELIHSAATNYCGFTRAQLAVFGIEFPPRKGWLAGLVGKRVTAETWAKFVEAKKKPKAPKIEQLLALYDAKP
jgi:hypothetical protein